MFSAAGRTRLLIFIFTTVTWISIAVRCDNTCPNQKDEECFSKLDFGNFSKCVIGFCECLDFFVYGRQKCIHTVPYGGSCIEPQQCQGGPMGELAYCNATLQCDCEKLTGSAIVLLEGRCTLVRKIGQLCVTDGQCFSGSNEFSKCNKGTCGCLSNDNVQFSPDEHGMCTLGEQGTTINLSVFAATMAGSVALLVLIVVIYRVTNPNRITMKTILQRKEVDEGHQKVSIEPVALPSQASSSNSVKVEISQ